MLPIYFSCRLCKHLLIFSQLLAQSHQTHDRQQVAQKSKSNQLEFKTTISSFLPKYHFYSRQMALANQVLAEHTLILFVVVVQVVVILIYFSHQPNKYRNSIFQLLGVLGFRVSINHSSTLAILNCIKFWNFHHYILHGIQYQFSFFVFFDCFEKEKQVLSQFFKMRAYRLINQSRVTRLINNLKEFIFAYSLSIYQMVQTQKIKIFRALLKRDLRTFSDMITYTQIQIGGITKKTMPDFKGGKKPTWNQIFQFKTSTTQVKITIYDQGKLSDELVGDANFDIKSLAQQKEEVIDVMFEGKVIGKIFIKILPTVLIVQPKEDNLLSSPMPKPPLSQTDRKTLQNAACNLLGKKIADSMLQQQNRQTPLKTTQKAPQIYPQQQMLAPLPQFYPPQAHIPQQIPMGPQAQMSPPVYYQHQQSMSPPRYNPPPQFVQPFTNSMNNVFQAPPGQIQHNFMIPSNMIMQSPVRSNQYGKISQENYNVAYNRVQNQRSINPFKDLTDLLL